MIYKKQPLKLNIVLLLKKYTQLSFFALGFCEIIFSPSEQNIEQFVPCPDPSILQTFQKSQSTSDIHLGKERADFNRICQSIGKRPRQSF